MACKTRGLRGGKLVSRATADRLTAAQGRMPSYGLGFQSRAVRGKSVRGHSGGGPHRGINGELAMFWDDSYTVVVLGNYETPAAQDVSRQVVEFLARQ
jgi:hypothetical protein